jgi:hypothetical protein
LAIDPDEAVAGAFAESGPRFLDEDAEDSAAEPITRFRQVPSRETLIDVWIGEFYRTAAARIVRDHDVAPAAEEFRRLGYETRIEKADDLGKRVACKRIEPPRSLPESVSHAPRDRVRSRSSGGLAQSLAILRPG